MSDYDGRKMSKDEWREWLPLPRNMGMTKAAKRIEELEAEIERKAEAIERLGKTFHGCNKRLIDALAEVNRLTADNKRWAEHWQDLSDDFVKSTKEAERWKECFRQLQGNAEGLVDVINQAASHLEDSVDMHDEQVMKAIELLRSIDEPAA